MGKLVLKMSVSVDGFVSSVNGEVDWIFKSSTDDSREWVLDTLSRAGVHVMGSHTFHDMATFWPSSASPLAPPMNEIPKIVFTRKGLTKRPFDQATAAPASIEGSWSNPIVANGELADEVALLKALPGKYVLAHGGASFAQVLAASGFIDEYRLMVHPIVLGKGIPLFAGLSRPLDLQLVSAIGFSGGATALVYRPR